MNVSTRQLRAFMSLAAERNFTRAAAASHLSQPAFSALIRQLEEAMGVRLFDRSTRHVALTVEGAEFEIAAQRVLAEFDAALSGMRERAERLRGRVSIALLPSLAADWLPGVLAGFRTAHPGIEMQVADVLSEPCIERVRSGLADFALAATRADTPELRAELFCSDDFHLVCPADHPLAKVRNPRPKDLAAWPFVHLSRTSSVRQYIDAATHPQTFPAVLEVDQLATVSGMVRAGLGISVVPALTLYQFRSPELVIRPIRWTGLTRRIYLVRRRDRGLSIAAQGFYEWVMARRPRETPSRARARAAA
ncbi:LysR family transcriptional regulator [Aquabacterium sp.]|uniref:LysR family transcriptional regulator n=1 Tax=Aquabacterium sp. TaxID=1872578 RepID=UPI002CD9F782|nr:LysR substrate-binding domain-containing protein [Aquabacterium sp.]HSW06607.1 LysR substrate-binding domain-containing protein [Aquabacterium sp.]